MMLFRTFKAGLVTLLGAQAAGRYNVEGYQRQRHAAEEFLNNLRHVEVIYNSGEFDEPTDGIIYATAAGLGYATVLNIQFVVTNGGVNLGAGVISMAVVALAQASFAGITGYFLGRAKFESDPIWWMPLGVTLAAVANGLFNWLRGLITRGGISLSGSTGSPWLGLVLAAVVAFAIMGLLLWLIIKRGTAH